MGLVSPLMLAAAGIAAVWERDRPPRLLLMGALGGMALFAVLSIFLMPGEAVDVESARQASESQGDLLQMLFALSAGIGAVGALWASARPDAI
jgi:hypothetical protein